MYVFVALFISLALQASIVCELYLSNMHQYNIQVVESAYKLAVKAHKDVSRKFEKTPYINHPNRVAKEVMYYSSKQELVIAALLHDVVEDSSISFKHIEKRFGKRVSSLVRELTSDKALIKRWGKTYYLTRKLNEISDDALLIKLLDRKDNLKDLKVAPQGFSKKYRDSTLQIINGLTRQLTAQHLAIIKDIRLLID